MHNTECSSRSDTVWRGRHRRKARRLAASIRSFEPIMTAWNVTHRACQQAAARQIRSSVQRAGMLGGRGWALGSGAQAGRVIIWSGSTACPNSLRTHSPAPGRGPATDCPARPPGPARPAHRPRRPGRPRRAGRAAPRAAPGEIHPSGCGNREHEGQRGEAALQAHPYPYPAPTPNQGNEEKLRSKPVPDIARKYYERVSSTYVQDGSTPSTPTAHYLLRTA